MTLAAQPAAPLKAPRSRRRRAAILLGLALVTVGVPVAAWLWFYVSDERALAAALAETERLDPHWRFDDILAHRAVVPDKENASLQVMVAINASGNLGDRFRKHFPTIQVEELRELSPIAALDDKQKVMLRAFWLDCPEAIAEARKLSDMPQGRPRIKYAPDFISTIVEPIQQARTVCTLLHCDMLVRIEDGDIEAAMVSCRAMLNAGRSIGEEPFVIAVLVRVACSQLTIDALERVLAHGEPSEAALAQMQAALEQELAEPTLLVALRGERAGLYQVLQMIEEGKIRGSYISAISGKPVDGLSKFVQDHVPARTTRDRIMFLNGMNALVEAAKLPVEQQAEPFDRILAAWKGREGSPILERKWVDKALSVHLRLQANMRSTVVRVAGIARHAGESAPARGGAARSVRWPALAIQAASRQSDRILGGTGSHR
jgi:hypothetical protein